MNWFVDMTTLAWASWPSGLSQPSLAVISEAAPNKGVPCYPSLSSQIPAMPRLAALRLLSP